MPYTYSSRVSNIIAFFLFLSLFLEKPTVENSLWCPLTSSASSNDTLQSKYDVFVSFRGPDVRVGFLSHLIDALSLNQIASFVDYNIPKGHQISDALLRAIQVSSIYLIIFSENYASSSWCLLELVKIVECSGKYGHMLLPIFYQVDPSDVRHQRGIYGEAFVAHEREYNLTTVQTWRFALKESANVAGFHSSTFRSNLKFQNNYNGGGVDIYYFEFCRDDAKLVKEIVKCVSSMVLNLRHKVNSKEPYEIGTQFPHAETFLRLKSEDLPVIGCIEYSHLFPINITLKEICLENPSVIIT
ncbi:hypothetical protein PHAVU_010G131800 [Phaseolus vulgaris]|uniref:TIR domain-containing protein n=1 Tax=Phaseolus vulgaris TaxID=3885 RepID=V7APF0_PHAVU|nr:hypothetical protein PHAVU_010G131800g [Phaseolus vulgaris]ESW07459.1 hypothetical protein PHAVU_010G131800g [Phaseolus vulgaris]